MIKRLKLKKENKKGMTWVATVLYVLISIAIIGILLSAVRPKIAEMKDKIIISQTMDSLNILEETVQLVKNAQGTNLKYNLQLNKGNFIIDSLNDRIIWEADSNYLFSELNKPISIGRITALSEPQGGIYKVKLMISYQPYKLNITFDGKDKTKTLNPASIPYTIWIKNNGKQGDKIWMDFYLG